MDTVVESVFDSMVKFEPGERVRIDIPDETDPDHDQHHGKHGTIVETISDSGGSVTGDEQDSVIYRVELETGTTADFRARDLRTPLE